jgi:predicted MFS family arabinose efflux permease
MKAEAPDSQRLAIGGLIAMACAVGIGRFIYTPILPPMVESLGLSKGQAGLIASANFVGYLAGALGAAALPIRQPRLWLLAALAASAVTTAAMAWPSDMASFLVLRLLGGVASAFVLVLASTLVLERLTVAARGDLAAVHFSGVGTGIAVSSLLTWGLLVVGGTWRGMWLWAGVLSVLGTVAAAVLIPEGQGQRPPPQAGRPTACGGGMVLLALAYGLVGFGYVVTATFIVAIVRGSGDVRTAEPLIWLVFGCSAIPSVTAWVAVGRKTGTVRAFATASVVEAFGVAASVAWQTLPGLFLASALLGGTFMGLTALGLIAAQSLAVDRRKAFALMTSAFGLGQIVGPLVAGYGYDLTGSFYLPSMIAAAGLMIGAVLVLAVREPAAASSQ